MNPLFTRVARATVASFLLLAAVGVAVASAAPGDYGFKDHSFGTGTSAPTASKPESKLWYNDGLWWGSLRGATGGYFIYRLNTATETWVNTGVAIDDRVGSRADTLWDGTKLYVASQNFSESGALTGGTARLYRYSYNTSANVYSLDNGFPVTMRANIRSETLVIAKDSTGTLWATWTQNVATNPTTCPTPNPSCRSVYTNHSQNGDDTSWSAPKAMPVGPPTSYNDDISTIVAFNVSGQGRIGVLWSHQPLSGAAASTSVDYFAWHVDGAADTSWTLETAMGSTPSTNPRAADDHLNLHADSNGRLYAIVKTSNDSGSLPEIMLLVREPGGGWSAHTVGTGSTHTRPIIVLDDTAGVIHAFLTGPTPPDTTGVSGGTIYEKTSSMSSISFPSGLGTPVIRDVTNVGNGQNNATSTKQNVNSTTGLVVLASNDVTDFYWHDHDTLIGGGPVAPQADFTANQTTGTAPLAVQFTNASTGTPTLTYAWNFGDPASGANNTSAATNPSHTYGTAGTYTVSLTATNGSGSDQEIKTGFITVTTGGGGGNPITLEPVADAQVKSDSASTNYGSATTIRLGGETGSTIYRSYLRFNVTGLSGPPSAVKLRLYATDASPNIVHVFPVTDTAWGEGTINWTNKPAMGGTQVGQAAVPTLNGYNDITLTGAVAGNGLVSFGMTIEGTNSAIFSSKEGANHPQLVVTPPAGPSNTAPTANPASATITEDAQGPVNLSGSDPETCQLTFSLVTAPTKGTVNFAGQTADPCGSGSPNTDTTTVTYTPNANATGADTFTYKVNDGTVDSSPATASITISPVNDPAVAQPTSASTTVNTAKVITLTGTDVDSCDLTFVTTAPGHGTLSSPSNPAGCANGNPNTDTETITYTPNNGFTGPDSFTFTVNDGSGASAPATVTLNVTASNTAPTANPASATITEDAQGPVNLSGSDPETCQLTFSLVTAPTKGTVNFAGQTADPCGSGSPNTDTTTVTYTPNANATGADTFTYKVNDGTVDSSPATASITISPVNDPAVAQPTSASTTVNTAKVITLTGTDVDSCDLTFVTTAPGHGTLSSPSNPAGCANGNPNTDTETITYTPNNGFTGPDSFTFTVNDGSGASAPATVSITVSGGSSTVTLVPTADAKVGSASPDTNYGTTVDLRTREENPISTNSYRSYLKFNVPALTGTVGPIKLRLYVTSPSVDATGVYPVADNSWIESGTGSITWNNAKPIGATLLGSAVAGPAVGYIEITLNNSAIVADGVARTYSFAIKAAGNHSGTYSSREAAVSQQPQLVITTGP